MINGMINMREGRDTSSPKAKLYIVEKIVKHFLTFGIFVRI